MTVRNFGPSALEMRMPLLAFPKSIPKLAVHEDGCLALDGIHNNLSPPKLIYPWKILRFHGIGAFVCHLVSGSACNLEKRSIAPEKDNFGCGIVQFLPPFQWRGWTFLPGLWGEIDFSGVSFPSPEVAGMRARRGLSLGREL